MCGEFLAAVAVRLDRNSLLPDLKIAPPVNNQIESCLAVRRGVSQRKEMRFQFVFFIGTKRLQMSF
jgi:hypothetical protein